MPTALHPDDDGIPGSATWGWHGGFAKGSLIAGWFSAIGMFLMMIGNHQGRIEDIYLAVIGIAMVLLLIRHTAKARRGWRG